MIDNTKSKSVVTHSSYMNICNSLYINIRNDDQTSNLIVSLLLEFKEIINSKDGKHLIVDNLFKRFDNYKKIHWG